MVVLFVYLLLLLVMSLPITTIVIGNPGVGKSTLLNCLLGTGVFPSGVSFGGGMTNISQTHVTHDGNRYVDTPGLSDIVLREQAGIEIQKALSYGGIFKVEEI